MVGGDRGGAVEIGDGARDFQDSRVGARAQSEAVDGELEQTLAARLDLAMEAEIARAHLRVAEKRHPLETNELRLARAIDALANGDRRLSRDAIGQVLVLRRGHFDLDFDEIQARAREAR